MGGEEHFAILPRPATAKSKSTHAGGLRSRPVARNRAPKGDLIGEGSRVRFARDSVRRDGESSHDEPGSRPLTWEVSTVEGLASIGVREPVPVWRSRGQAQRVRPQRPLFVKPSLAWLTNGAAQHWKRPDQPSTTWFLRPTGANCL